MATSHYPPLPEGAPERNSYRYTEQFAVIIKCQDEAEHKKVYEALSAQGYKCKAVRT